MEQRREPLDDGQPPTSATAWAENTLRIVVTADNHLSAYTPRLSPQRLSERRQRLREAFALVVDGAIARQAHLFFQAGDLFDSTDPRNLEREFVAAQLVRLRAAGIRVFAVSGNHDTPRQRTEHGGHSPQGVYAQLGGLHYFAEARRIQPVALAVGGLRVAVAGLSYDQGAPVGSDPLVGVTLDDPDAALASADLGILVVHAAIEGHGFPSETESFVRRASLDALGGFHLVLTGHIHSYARFRVGGTSVVICGATERMEFGASEGAPGYAYLELTRDGLTRAEHVGIVPQPRHTITMHTADLWPARRVPRSADSTTLPPADVGAPALVADALPLADSMPPPAAGDAPSPDATAPTAAILARLEPYCTPDAMVRLRLEGPITREQYRSLDVRQIWFTGQRSAFSFELDESALVLATDGTHARIASAGRVAPHAVLEQIASEWLERAESPEERALLAKTRERVLDRYAAMTRQEADQ